MPFNSFISWISEYFKQTENENNESFKKFKKPDAYKNINSFTILNSSK